MSGSVIYTEVVEDDPGAVYLVRRDVRSNGHKEQSLRVPNDLIKTAIEQLLRVMPEPEGPQSLQEQDMADQFSSAAETVKPSGNAECARCGHGRRSHLHGVDDCFGRTDADVPCICLKYLPPEARRRSHCQGGVID